ncbi:MAG: M23 family metallopeptidase [Bacteroidota bacterium]|nr:M23 family metallopeptidase [Bacteroidota bacterium]
MPAPDGTPIRAAAKGTVKYAGPASGYGYEIIIDHGNGYTTVYGHMRKNTVKVKAGDPILNGQILAGVSNNGTSRGQNGGYHLHYELLKDGVKIDPESIYDLNTFLYPDEPVNPEPYEFEDVNIYPQNFQQNKSNDSQEKWTQYIEEQRQNNSFFLRGKLHEGDHGYLGSFWDAYDAAKSFGTSNDNK